MALAAINCGSASLISSRGILPLVVLLVLVLVFAVYFSLGDPNLG